MSKISGILSTLLILLITCKIQAIRRIEPDCVTPDNALGSCVDVRYCVTIMTALINGDHLTNPTIGKFLRESQCGIAADSQKVCCHINSIDFGESPTADRNSTVIPIPPIPANIPPTQPTPIVPPLQNPHQQQQPAISDFEKCGKLEHQHETPLQWIAELWYKHNKLGRSVYESKCLGTVISLKHVIVPAHCVASLPAHISLDHLTINNDEYLIGKILIHGSYNQPKFANDIAIIELDVELSQSRSPVARAPQQIYNAVCLGSLNANVQNEKSSVAYMKTEQGPIRHVKTSFISNNQCSDFFNQQFTDLTSSQFCATIKSTDTDISPFIGAIIMTYDNSRWQYSLKGFTSTIVRTEQSFDESRPYIFTDVEKYMNWIRSALAGDIQSERPHDDNFIDDNSKVLDGLKECQLDNERGRCVIEDYCSFYQSRPYETSRIKCSTGNNRIDGICCPEKHINQSALTVYDFDVRFKPRRGIELLDMGQCGLVDPSRRIVGGRQADLKEFPWFALIKYKYGRVDKLTCGGSLISSRYVLTCAHCITKLPNGYTVVAVRLGEYDLTTDPDCRDTYDDRERECNPPFMDIDIENLIPHAQYNNPRYSNDIGLIRMTQNVEIKRGGLIPICLPINEEMQQTLSNKSTVAGFGLTENGRDSDILLKIVVPKVPREACQSFHRTSIQLAEGHACYGGEGIIDSCKGDSGSPLLNYVVVKGKLTAVQMGIVASGHSECGRGVTGFPGIYTDVAKYMDWILDNIDDD